MEGTMREFKHTCEGWKEETEVVRGASFSSMFDIDEIKQMSWFKYMEEIVSNRYDFVYSLFYLEPMKQFECRSDMLVLKSAGEGASWCILNLFEAFGLGDGK